MNSKPSLPAAALLFAALLAFGLVPDHSARAAAQDVQSASSTAAPGTSASRPGASNKQVKVSPYATMNRQRAQANTAGAAKPAQPALPGTTHKPPSAGARKG